MILGLFPVNFMADDMLLLLSVLVFVAILVSKIGFKYGVPSLLLFLGVGMLFGQDGMGIEFDNFNKSQFFGNWALSVIILAGGLQTDFKKIKPILAPGVMLSTLGVVLTALFTGIFIYLIFRVLGVDRNISLIVCCLLAAVMSSTDSASVFSILKGSKMKLKEHLQPMLELESGSNDPMAFVLTIVLTHTILNIQNAGAEHMNTVSIILNSLFVLFLQIASGVAVGFAIGYGARWLLRKFHLHDKALYAIMVLCIGFFSNSFAEVVKGNGLLALYITGIIIGNTKDLPNRGEVFTFFDSFTWLAQALIFLLLGLLVDPSELPTVALPAILACLFMSFVGRPLSVFICLFPFRKFSMRARIFVSWVGLKGAGPILFAIYPVVSKMDGSKDIFNIVFVVTLISLLIQGMTLASSARWLKVEKLEEDE